MLAQEPGDVDEGSVPCFMAVLIVDALEAVEIGEQQRDRRPVARPVGNRPGKIAEEAAAVQKAREGVLLGQGFEQGRVGPQVRELGRQPLDLAPEGVEFGADVGRGRQGQGTRERKRPGL